MMMSLYLPLWIAIAFLALLALALLYEYNRLAARVAVSVFRGDDGLAIGSTLPNFARLDLWSGEQILSSKFVGQGSLLVFISSSCPRCRVFIRSLKSVLVKQSEFKVVVACYGKENDCRFLCSPPGGMHRW